MNGPYSSKRTNMNYDTVKKVCNELNIRIYVHSAYVAVAAWNAKDKTDKSIDNLIDYLDDAAKINSGGFVLHVPRHKIDTIVKTLNFLNDRV
jgi:endonuclease IV